LASKNWSSSLLCASWLLLLQVSVAPVAIVVDGLLANFFQNGNLAVLLLDEVLVVVVVVGLFDVSVADDVLAVDWVLLLCPLL
jgi:hypothetical protein